MGYIGVIQSGECGPRLGRGSYVTRKRRISERKKERLGLGKDLIISKSENQQPGKHLHICMRISRLLLAQARDSFISKERIPTKLRISVIEMITWPLTRHFISKKSSTLSSSPLTQRLVFTGHQRFEHSKEKKKHITTCFFTLFHKRIGRERP